MNKAFAKQDRWIYLMAILASASLAVWANSRMTLINPDAICYLLTAEEIGKTGLGGALHICGQALAWPFFSTLIYALAHVTSLSYVAAAQWLDGFFSLLSVVTFIAIVKQLGGSQRVMVCAALVILLSHEFNSIRQYIVRDHGFWAFYLISLWCCLRYFQQPRWTMAFCWSMSLVIASLFRIEGAIFLLIVPLCVWLRGGDSFKQRLGYFCQLNVVTSALVVLMMSWLWLHPEQTLLALGRVHTLADEWQHWLLRTVTRFQAAKTGLVMHVLPPESSREAGLVLMLMTTIWYLVSLLSNLSWIYAVLTGYAIITRAARFSRTALWVLGAYLSVNLIVTVGFFAENFFLSNRYLMAFSLVLMLWTPFALAALWQYWLQRQYRPAFAIVALCIIGSALGGIFDFGYSKVYVRDAASWVASNIPQQAEFFTNNRQLRYYARDHHDFFALSKRQTKQNKIAPAWWKQYDYVALRLSSRETDPIATAERGLLPMQSFKNKRGDRVVIYQIPKEQPGLRITS